MCNLCHWTNFKLTMQLPEALLGMHVIISAFYMLHGRNMVSHWHTNAHTYRMRVEEKGITQLTVSHMHNNKTKIKLNVGKMENRKFTQCGLPRLLDLNQFPTCIIYNYPSRKFTGISNYLQYLYAADRWSFCLWACFCVCVWTLACIWKGIASRRKNYGRCFNYIRRFIRSIDALKHLLRGIYNRDCRDWPCKWVSVSGFFFHLGVDFHLDYGFCYGFSLFPR